MYGFFEDDLKKFWSEDEFYSFLRFMRGQTVAKVKERIFYHSIDVQKFCGQYGVRFPSMYMHVI